MPKKATPPCCSQTAKPGAPQMCGYRIHANLSEALSPQGQSKPFVGPDEGAPANIFRFEGEQENVGGKPPIELFTHVGDRGCCSTRGFKKGATTWNPPKIEK